MTEGSDCKTCSSSSCAAKGQKPGESQEEFLERQAMTAKLCRIKHKIIVLSGKGGVGKSTVSANLAMTLAELDNKTGLMDVDIHGPSIPRILGLEGKPTEVLDGELVPIPLTDNLKAVSIGFLMRERDEAVIWRGPMKMGVIKQFIRDVAWGDLDFLVIDSPPGTGDEPLSVVQLIPDIDGAVIVTTPQDLSVIDVRRSIQFCRTVNLPVLGVIENMSGFVCPHCGETTEIFKSGGGEQMAKEMKVPFLGRIPLDPAVGEASDRGEPFVTAVKDSATAKAFKDAFEPMVEKLKNKE